MLKKYNNDLEIGIDEAGRGPLCGRVYAGAVIWSIDPTKENDKEYKLIKHGADILAVSKDSMLISIYE